MVWIKEAEEIGRVQAEEEATREAMKAADKTTFDAESFSEEKVAAHLENYQAPVLSIINDLIKAGYKVEKYGPGYTHHSYEEDSEYQEDLSEFALTKRVESTGWGATDYSKWERKVFAIGWEVSKEGLNKDDSLLGIIYIYPIMDRRTHYAGVQYRTVVAKGWPRAPHIIDGSDITAGLQQEVRGWIVNNNTV